MPALHKIERAAIAAATHITYPPAELLMLVEDHLRASGLHASADKLAQEAGLARLPTDGLPRLIAEPGSEPRVTQGVHGTPFLTPFTAGEPGTPAILPSKGGVHAA